MVTGLDTIEHAIIIVSFKYCMGNRMHPIERVNREVEEVCWNQTEMDIIE